jgi:hypothetical protein
MIDDENQADQTGISSLQQNNTLGCIMIYQRLQVFGAQAIAAH